MERYREIDGRQRAEGYYELIGGIVYHREYSVVRRTPHGTYIVRESEPPVSDPGDEDQGS